MPPLEPNIQGLSPGSRSRWASRRRGPSLALSVGLRSSLLARLLQDLAVEAVSQEETSFLSESLEQRANLSNLSLLFRFEQNGQHTKRPETQAIGHMTAFLLVE